MIILPSVILLLIMLVQNEWMIDVEAIVDGVTVDKNEFPFALDSPYTFDKYITKAELVPKGYYIPNDLTVNIIGWGVEKSDTTTPSRSLKKTQVTVLSHSKCIELYTGKVKVSDTVFCTAHNRKNNRGICYGDSGGPVVKDKTVVIGVISVNYAKTKCGDKNHPDLQTNVAKYRQWIDNTIFNNI
ncbi:trypsin Tyr p 3.0101-like [Phymastichus coffea]|uniref:trypsin Tyr p 3.0101-like n=1 Tax=Phymastichus coffea TaxID=108790 RepID=UPI00273C0B48|nr:trypsin Tyr p 3.0101-like [Phymastichus coffea]